MKEVNLNFNLKGVDGVELPEANAGKLVAKLLAESNKGDALKMFAWAKELYSGNTLNLDPSDAKILNEFISTSEMLTNLAKAQIVEIL
jgi:hypothetical protein